MFFVLPERCELQFRFLTVCETDFARKKLFHFWEGTYRRNRGYRTNSILPKTAVPQKLSPHLI